MASTFYIERMPRRFKAMQWTGDNLDEVRELDPWAIEWDPTRKPSMWTTFRHG